MSVILLPNGLPGTLQRETLSKEEVNLITSFEAWCQRRNITLDLLCTKCVNEGHGRASRLQGNNLRNSNSYHVKCAHADRVYGAA